LLLRKISKFDAARCQILRLKCTKFDFRWGAYSASQTAQLYLRVPTSEEREENEGGKEEGERKRRKGKGGNGPTNRYFFA